VLVLVLVRVPVLVLMPALVPVLVPMQIMVQTPMCASADSGRRGTGVFCRGPRRPCWTCYFGSCCQNQTDFLYGCLPDENHRLVSYPLHSAGCRGLCPRLSVGPHVLCPPFEIGLLALGRCHPCSLPVEPCLACCLTAYPADGLPGYPRSCSHPIGGHCSDPVVPNAALCSFPGVRFCCVPCHHGLFFLLPLPTFVSRYSFLLLPSLASVPSSLNPVLPLLAPVVWGPASVLWFRAPVLSILTSLLSPVAAALPRPLFRCVSPPVSASLLLPTDLRLTCRPRPVPVSLCAAPSTVPW
ncbi:uncharacterized protein LOC119098069, partial [Pollicipes pollicipes]|uniref:uncharacterized protein LOC119098069 n=1 Tax=Pollicipes pollicipes TaxID=41117 RepID=UPI001885529E